MTLSVVIAAKNEERHLPEQLLAVQTQGHTADEIILVDDGSTDGTYEIMRDFARFVRAARVIRLSVSVGATAAYNRGVAESTGDWIYCASANDVLRPGAFAWLAQVLEMWPGRAGALITGDLAGVHLGWSITGGPQWFSADEVCALLGPLGIVHGASTFVSRWAWQEAGGWHDDVGPYVDALMWHALAARHGLIYTPHPIAWVRPNEPGQGNGGAVVHDRQRRQPYLEAFARRVLAMPEPARSRLINSGLWSISEFAPDTAAIFAGGRQVLS